MTEPPEHWSLRLLSGVLILAALIVGLAVEFFLWQIYHEPFQHALQLGATFFLIAIGGAYWWHR